MQEQWEKQLEQRTMESRLAEAETNKKWLEMTLLPQIESERKANERLTAEVERLTTERDELRAKIESGVRVHAEYMIDTNNQTYWDCFEYDISNATLILDDGVEI